MSDWWTGMLFAFAIPAKKRVQKSMNAFTARPERNTKNPKNMLANPTMGTRFTRSASHPIGTAPSTKNADDAPPMNCAVPLLMWNVWTNSGSKTCMAAPSSSSSATRSPSTMNINLPPAANAVLKLTGSELTPGNRSSGKITCSRERACASWRASSSSRTAEASDAAFPVAPGTPSTGSSIRPPVEGAREQRPQRRPSLTPVSGRVRPP